MRSNRLTTLGCSLLLATFAGVAFAAPVQLAPFKDDLFNYPTGSARSDGGDRVDVAYSELRDINERDEVPERRVAMDYVDAAALRRQVDVDVDTPAGRLRTIQVGERRAPAAAVVFVHGRNGDRRLGMYDRTFGGNFNRLKNLMDRANGLYVTVDAGSFGDADRARVAAFVKSLAERPNRPPVILACASMGGEFCWDLLRDPATVKSVSGVVMLAANNVPGKVDAMRKARAPSASLPLVLVHGTRDKVFAWDATEALYETLHGAGYPVRFVSMTSGNHGTPIRMIDWRESLNWLLSRAGR